MTYVFKLSDCNSILQKRLYHPVNSSDLNVALIGFYTTYVTPNVSKYNNILHYEEKDIIKELIIPIGQYNVSTLEDYINSQPPFNTNNISIKGNDATNRINIRSPIKLHLDKNKSIGEILGFNSVLDSNKNYVGTNIPKFHPFETINIHCNLANGMFLKATEYKHRKSDIIASFRTNAEFKEPIIYEPHYPLSFPIQHKEFDHIIVSVLDEDDKVIDFDKSLVTIILKVAEKF